MLGKHLHECNNYMYKKVVICFHHFSEYFKDEKTVDSKFLKLKSVRICSVLYITLSIKCFSHLLIWNNLTRYFYRWKPKNPGSKKFMEYYFWNYFYDLRGIWLKCHKCIMPTQIQKRSLGKRNNQIRHLSSNQNFWDIL